jgi:hypothetical protein
MQQQYLSEELRECINTCLQCFAQCTETVQYCLAKGGKFSERAHISILELCAETCQLTARSMLLESPFYGDFCDHCAKICEACADNCNALNDVTLDETADICRQCARACNEMHAEAEEWKWARREAEAGSAMHI